MFLHNLLVLQQRKTDNNGRHVKSGKTPHLMKNENYKAEVTQAESRWNRNKKGPKHQRAMILRCGIKLIANSIQQNPTVVMGALTNQRRDSKKQQQ